ncbi:hypothetical protein [Pseudonocardia hierapolitana]|uniref:hypothetical protein n=1 Tax=Pseudonocardia hierapolitana TaxID=1128676 RepID=UPI0011BD69E9|nr:hypothetical protein [Pseudonocardia hierapolitana]
MNTGTGAIAAGIVRLVLLAMAATGFLAMHGVAATDPVAGHISPLDSHSVTAPAESAMAMPDVGPETVASSGNPRHHHDDMAACAFILLTVLAGIVLHALGVAAGGRTRGVSALIRSRWSPPRAPPQPLFLSLCVFRL